MIACRAPGKLYIAGEYAVIEPGFPAVLIAVDRYTTAHVAEADATAVTSDLFGDKLISLERVDGRLVAPTCDGLDYVTSAIWVVERLLTELGHPVRQFRLRLTSALHDGRGMKYGLGSSAAVTVATIAALARFHGLRLELMDRYRLAMLATIRVAPDCSGGDVAASTWGGWISYRGPDRGTLSRRLRRDGVEVLLRENWPGLSVKALPTPTSARVVAGWTGHPATTRAEAGVIVGDDSCAGFRAASRDCVDRLSAAIEDDDPMRIREQLRRARLLLEKLDTATGLGIMTPELAGLCAIAESVGAVAKPSGAGGGDCGIALVTSDAQLTQLRDRWRAGGIQPLPLHTHPTEQDQP
ncbi:phosphomevalonate kinase [Nocardia tenerifensis]|uniref:phosphomevalonate kinase n=1 Tax=Nocardia tenerifensis TaxID=228006 RepID=A0A318JXR1_9NOCA|nr:phosphomevalonate kinase [Nocardia tenerifensis]PXX61768.1 phosphomevalonate kinase [Nocardia tenerifensis]